MENENISSGQDYARVITDRLIQTETEVSFDERMDPVLLEYWCEEIREYADVTWNDYIIGKRDSFKFDEDEVRKLYEKAGMRFAADILDSLVDKEMVQVGVRNDGELVYSLTEKGKDYVQGED